MGAAISRVITRATDRRIKVIYFIVLALLLSSSPLDRPSFRVAYLLIGFTLLLFILGARWETGTDWGPYNEYFQDLDNYRNFEPGYVLINEVVRIFSDNYTVFLFVNGFLALAPIFWFIRKESRGSIPLGLAIFYSYYYLITYFGATRRIMAIGLCILASIYLLDKSHKIALSLILLGSCFHYSAIICIFYFPLVRYYISFYNLFRLAIITLTAIIIIYLALPFLIKIDIFSNVFFRVGEYLIGDTSVDGYDKKTTSLLSIFKRLVIIFFIAYSFLKNKNQLGYREIFFANCYIFSFAIYLVSEFMFGDIFKTLTIYFSIFEMVLIPTLISTYRFKLRFILYFIFLLYLIIQTYSATFGNPFVDLYIPYRLAPFFGSLI